SNREKITTIELDEHKLLPSKLAQADLLPHRAGQREVRCNLPDLQSCGLKHTYQHASQHHTDQHHMADGWCLPLHGLPPLHDRMLLSHYTSIPGQHGTT